MTSDCAANGPYNKKILELESGPVLGSNRSVVRIGKDVPYKASLDSSVPFSLYKPLGRSVSSAAINSVEDKAKDKNECCRK